MRYWSVYGELMQVTSIMVKLGEN
uniref:Uncharacterized protein n=1 Tax=Arundo donax TaxID=35708 RepID=A0A0A9I1K4_ARUDO